MATRAAAAAPVASGGDASHPPQVLLNSLDIAVIVVYFGLVMLTGLYVSMRLNFWV